MGEAGLSGPVGVKSRVSQGYLPVEILLRNEPGKKAAHNGHLLSIRKGLLGCLTKFESQGNITCACKIFTVKSRKQQGPGMPTIGKTLSSLKNHYFIFENCYFIDSQDKRIPYNILLLKKLKIENNYFQFQIYFIKS